MRIDKKDDSEGIWETVSRYSSREVGNDSRDSPLPTELIA
jgi:hypothetical protein